MNAGEPAETCPDGSCVTCADEAVAVRVLRLLKGQLAVVATDAGEEVVSVALVPARPGDTVLVHAGESIAIVKE
jgi:hydrogenase expression/formation protein HypC